MNFQPLWGMILLFSITSVIWYCTQRISKYLSSMHWFSPYIYVIFPQLHRSADSRHLMSFAFWPAQSLSLSLTSDSISESVTDKEREKRLFSHSQEWCTHTRILFPLSHPHFRLSLPPPSLSIRDIEMKDGKVSPAEKCSEGYCQYFFSLSPLSILSERWLRQVRLS